MPPKLGFTKMHGAGNDFVVLDLREAEPPSPAVCGFLADRHRGVGCDLILGIGAPRSPEAVASFGIWTADGSRSPQCGNGARCVAAWLIRAGLARGPLFTLDSPSRTHVVEVLSERLFTVDMGVPDFAPERIPLNAPVRSGDGYEAEIDGSPPVRFSAVSMGNPHAVIETEDVDTAEVTRIGQALRATSFLPATVNVGFAQVVTRDRLRLRVHEYGAGETLACGSGACAAAAVLMRRGVLDESVSITLPGGDLRVEWPGTAGPISLTGPAEFVYEGHFSR